MNIELFKALAAANILNDNDKMEIHITKVGDEFTVMTVITKDGKKAHPVISGLAEELDEAYLTEISKPIEKIKGLVSNADTVEITDDEEKETVTETPKKAETKKPTKKAAAKKVEAIAEADPKEEEEEHEEKDETLEPPAVETLDFILEEIPAIQQAKRHIKEEEVLQKAAELFPSEKSALYPDDKTILDAYNKKVKYNNAMITAEIITVPREEWEKGGSKWH